jgi:hypothetical protein
MSDPGRNPGLKRTQKEAIFKKFYTKMILKLKINLIRNTLNFVSIQWNYLQAPPISWRNPFKKNLIGCILYQVPDIVN